MLLAITEKEMFLFDSIKIEKRTVLTGTNDDSDDCITCSTQDEKNGMITSYPIFTSRYGKTKEEFVNEVRRLNGNRGIFNYLLRKICGLIGTKNIL